MNKNDFVNLPNQTPIETAIQKRTKLQKQILELILDYEKKTGLIVFNIDYKTVVLMDSDGNKHGKDLQIGVGLPPPGWGM